jgi:zinc-ribbon domain
MALISCPTCGKEVSQLAPACPHCGQPIAGSVREAPPQTIVIQQPKSGGFRVGCGLPVVLVVLAGIIAAATKPDQAAMQKAIVEKHGIGFGIGAAIGQAIGTSKITYNDYLLFSTATIEGIGGAKSTIATGYFGHVSVSDL